MELLERGIGPQAVAELCGVSRQVIHKWKGRFDALGEEGLQSQSRAPKVHRDAVSAKMRAQVIKVRRRYKEGPRKLRKYMLDMDLDEKVPAASTIGLILKEAGLTETKPRRRRSPSPQPTGLTEAREPNDVWTVDYKGEFLVGKHKCYPLTLQDRCSRKILAIQADRATYTESTNSGLWRAFRTYGLPTTIRVDNGTPFISCTSPAGLTRVSTVWVRLGIQIERTRPGKPSDNGRHERFHKTLKRRTAKPPAKTWSAQQQRFYRFRRHYNAVRPHESLDMRTPDSLYEPSERPCPTTLPEIEHLPAQELLRIYADGGTRFRSFRFHLGLAFADQTVALTESADDIYTMSYGTIYLGFIDLRGKKGRFFQAP